MGTAHLYCGEEEIGTVERWWSDIDEEQHLTLGVLYRGPELCSGPHQLELSSGRLELGRMISQRRLVDGRVRASFSQDTAA